MWCCFELFGFIDLWLIVMFGVLFSVVFVGMILFVDLLSLIVLLVAIIEVFSVIVFVFVCVLVCGLFSCIVCLDYLLVYVFDIWCFICRLLAFVRLLIRLLVCVTVVFVCWLDAVV